MCRLLKKCYPPELRIAFADSEHLRFPGGSTVKNLPAMQETQDMWGQSLGQEDNPGEGMATHSSILGWRILWTEEPGRLQSMGSQRVGHNRVTNTSTFFFKRYSSNLEAKNSRIRKTFSQVV